ncbi:hypothetical protein FJZ22_01420 [Candidatus Pacearchaeota archaeon]|nr:hypothetical protein [Candidatus Pacearchaeota archaeon]
MEQKLQLVEHIAQLFGNVNLSRTLIIGCQHIQLPQFQMFLSLFEKGLKPSNTYLLGKCYSTDKESLRLFVEKGVKIHKASEAFDSHKSYDEDSHTHVKEFFQGIVKQVSFKEYDNVILLDDGGFLLSLANEELKKVHKIIGVEQTSSGYERLKNLELNFPIINVARSKAKLVYETPIIVNQFIKNLKHELKKINRKPRNALIMGNGAIGKGIAESLKKHFSVSIYDINKQVSDFESLENLNKKIKDFDLIIGCVGKSSFPLSSFNKLKRNAILASVSSSDREFSAPYLRLLDEQYTDCHKNVKIRDIYVLNSGFPVTFTEHSIGADPKDMQLTMSLLFSGICTSNSKELENQIVSLDDSIQNEVIRKFEELRK